MTPTPLRPSTVVIVGHLAYCSYYLRHAWMNVLGWYVSYPASEPLFVPTQRGLTAAL